MLAAMDGDRRAAFLSETIADADTEAVESARQTIERIETEGHTYTAQAGAQLNVTPSVAAPVVTGQPIRYVICAEAPADAGNLSRDVEGQLRTAASRIGTVFADS
jgi:16S rRNA G527 N7-methylase RsmG